MLDQPAAQLPVAQRTNPERSFAEEVRALIKGHGDTYKRGLASYRRITAEVIEPALASRMTPRAAADAVASARVAALADPEGDAPVVDPELNRRCDAIVAACRGVERTR